MISDIKYNDVCKNDHTHLEIELSPSCPPNGGGSSLKGDAIQLNMS